jgi:hypothetical protein
MSGQNVAEGEKSTFTAERIHQYYQSPKAQYKLQCEGILGQSRVMGFFLGGEECEVWHSGSAPGRRPAGH